MVEAAPGSGAQGGAIHAARARAAGIYGTIVTAAVLATGGAGRVGVLSLALLVFGTLVVYWMAELYAEVLGEHVHEGRLPRGAELRSLIASSWHMVTASYVPLVVLVTAALLGLSVTAASYAALTATVLLLLFHGHAAGADAGLSGARLLGVTAIAGLLGILMVLLKIVISH
jgi:hypothetical protein